MGKCLFMRKGETHTAPKVPGIALADIAVGSIVKLNENGTPVEFYVAKHNYESGLNGNGRTLLVRKDIHSNRAFHTSNVGAFAASTICTWLNGTYLNLFDETTKAAIGSTTFRYTPGNGNWTLTTLSKSVFLPSVTEMNQEGTLGVNTEGSPLPIANTLWIAYLNGAASEYWLRTPVYEQNRLACFIGTNGIASSAYAGNSKGTRPCFTLPATAKFNPDTLLFEGVA